MKYIVRLQSEILNDVRQAASEEEKISLLRKNKSETLLNIFNYTYGEYETPYSKGVPKYKPDDSPYGYSYTTLHKEVSRLLYFYKSDIFMENDKLRDKKLKNILEVLHFSEAALLENVFKHNLDCYGITKELVVAAYPELQKMWSIPNGQ